MTRWLHSPQASDIFCDFCSYKWIRVDCTVLLKEARNERWRQLRVRNSKDHSMTEEGQSCV